MKQILERKMGMKKPRIGLYSVGLKAYWEQFAGLFDCLKEYNAFISIRLSEYGEVFNFGMVDDEYTGRAAGEFFSANHTDIVFMHMATYCTSSCFVPVHQLCSAPVVVLSLQPTAEMAYEKTGTDRWLAQCVECAVPEAANAFTRVKIPYHVINGLLGLDYTPEFAAADEKTAGRPEAVRAWKEIKEWCMAAGVKRSLQQARFGFLGGFYHGMLDMYSDLTLLSSQTGIVAEILEMSDLRACMKKVTVEDIGRKISQIEEFFDISGPSSSDPIALKPARDQIEWSARVAAAQEILAGEYDLDSITYYCHGLDDEDEEIQSGFIVGFSMLNAQGVICAGEGDIKTALAMKISDLCGKGGSFSEIVASDFNRNTIILGHDGPFHIAISKGKPILRGMSVFHGKRGSGLSVEAKVQNGPVTALGITQTGDGQLRMIISEGEAIDAPILLNGNTMTHIRFGKDPVDYMDEWFSQAPTHHLALTIGHNACLFKKIAVMISMPCIVF